VKFSRALGDSLGRIEQPHAASVAEDRQGACNAPREVVFSASPDNSRCCATNDLWEIYIRPVYKCGQEDPDCGERRLRTVAYAYKAHGLGVGLFILE
jgi:hypothetical protein